RIGSIIRLLTIPIFVTVSLGAGVGAILGMTSVRYVQTLLFGVHGVAASMFLAPTFVLLAAVLLAAFPAVLRAVHIDPTVMLRAD
ncbi:MAG TPA: hypothetical protein VIM62_05370, partial [Acidobacteriaceae bacterium]